MPVGGAAKRRVIKYRETQIQPATQVPRSLQDCASLFPRGRNKRH